MSQPTAWDKPLADAPVLQAPAPDWEHHQLYLDVQEALLSLPSTFTAELNVSGVLATDIFTLNSAFGAMIEEQCVESLNRARLASWDRDGTYSLYSFVRQAQRFPDVLLKKPGSVSDILFGIELKGWYLLAKEGEPSFRFTVTPNACAPADLLVVVPWVLSNVIAGSPRVFSPYVQSARFAAEYRNYYWQHSRGSADDTGIVQPASVDPYPSKSTQIADRAVSDAGGNFGRFARTGLMREYIAALDDQPLRGIPARHWRSFFKAFQDQSDPEIVERAVEQLSRRIRSAMAGGQAGSAQDRYSSAERIIRELRSLLELE